MFLFGQPILRTFLFKICHPRTNYYENLLFSLGTCQHLLSPWFDKYIHKRGKQICISKQTIRNVGKVSCWTVISPFPNLPTLETPRTYVHTWPARMYVLKTEQRGDFLFIWLIIYVVLWLINQYDMPWWSCFSAMTDIYVTPVFLGEGCDCTNICR